MHRRMPLLTNRKSARGNRGRGNNIHQMISVENAYYCHVPYGALAGSHAARGTRCHAVVATLSL